jgi:hypothetical protein
MPALGPLLHSHIDPNWLRDVEREGRGGFENQNRQQTHIFGATGFAPASRVVSIDSQRLLDNERSEVSDTLIRKNHLWFTPAAFPFYRGLAVLGKSSAASKALKVLKTTVLKRLRSAIALRQRGI